jgi:hypothetical protein
MKRPIGVARRASFLVLALVLGACSGGGDSGSGSTTGIGGTGLLTVRITDAAVDRLSEVNLQVTALELRVKSQEGQEQADGATGRPEGSGQRGAGGPPGLAAQERLVRIEFDPFVQFNLLDYQSGKAFELFKDEPVPAGEYVWARLVLRAPAQTPNQCAVLDPTSGSHVVQREGGAVLPLFIPSGANAGLRLVRPFTVLPGGQTDVMIDFDARQSLTLPGAFEDTCYFLRPVLRIITLGESGNMQGQVAASLLTGDACSDTDPLTGNAVYVYEGLNRDPDDLPPTLVATGRVGYDPLTGTASYFVGYLPSGEYTVAFSCRADIEQPGERVLGSASVQANRFENVSIESGSTTIRNFGVD